MYPENEDGFLRLIRKPSAGLGRLLKLLRADSTVSAVSAGSECSVTAITASSTIPAGYAASPAVSTNSTEKTIIATVRGRRCVLVASGVVKQQGTRNCHNNDD
jgi:hypothetical protein